MNHQQSAVRFLVMGFSLIVMAISAATSFGFFYNFFPNFLPPSLFGETIAAVAAGVVGVVLLDLAAVKWMLTYLHASDTNEQRAVSLILSMACFAGAAVASVAHLALTAYSENVITPGTESTIQLIALVMVIAAVVANFAGVQAYQRYGLENKARVMESNRRDMLQAAEDEQARMLDQLVSREMKQLLSDLAPQLAQEQARRLVASFQQREQAKYHLPGQAPPQPGLVGEPDNPLPVIAPNGRVSGPGGLI